MRRAAVASLAVGASLAGAVGSGLTQAAVAAPAIPHSFRHFKIPASELLRAHAPAGGGYELRLTADHEDVPAQNGEPARSFSYVSLQLAKPGATAEYAARKSRFRRDGTVAAAWAENGRVAARFVPLHVHLEPVRMCDGSYAVETGRLVGVLSFRGEHGYAGVRARAVPATLYRRPPMECHIPATTKPHESHGSSSVSGSFSRRGRQLGVSADLHPALGTLTVYAYSSVRRAGVRVNRWVSAVAPLTALAFDPVAEAATLTAPSPFTGSATYRAFPGKEAGTWRGDLSVDFPGEPGVRLAGKRFQGAKLKPGECGPDSGSTCLGIRALSPVGLKPALPLGARPAG